MMKMTMMSMMCLKSLVNDDLSLKSMYVGKTTISFLLITI